MPGQHLIVWAKMFGIYMPGKGKLYHPASMRNDVAIPQLLGYFQDANVD
jgi:hypothetical protein